MSSVIEKKTRARKRYSFYHQPLCPHATDTELCLKLYSKLPEVS